MTMVMSGSLAGADMITLRAPAVRCLAAFSRSLNKPVHSAATSTPSSFHFNCSGSFMEVNVMDRPSTSMALSFACISRSSLPCTESYVSRCAMVAASVKSLIATTSTSGCFNAALNTSRPILPNPLIPILILIFSSCLCIFIREYFFGCVYLRDLPFKMLLAIDMLFLPYVSRHSVRLVSSMSGRELIALMRTGRLTPERTSI